MTIRSRQSGTAYAATGDLFKRWTTDVPTPLYKARVASGELICNPFDSIVYQAAGPKFTNVGFNVLKLQPPWPPLNLGMVQVSTSRPMVSASAYGSLYGIQNGAQTAAQKCGIEPLVYDGEAFAEAHTGLSAQLNTGISSILVTLAELGKTATMIAKAARLLRNPIINAKNKLRLTRAQLRTPEGRKAALDMAEDDWLEGRYGWRPFIYDTMSIVDAAQAKYGERLTVKTLVDRLAGEATEVKEYTSVGVPPLIMETKWKVEFMLSCGQTADFDLNFSQFARTWGALDVVGTAWDLVKLSFVIDWFINLGDSLKALQVYLFIAERIGWNKISSTARVERKYSLPAIGTYGDRQVNLHLNSDDRILEQVKTTHRTPVDSFLPNLGMSFNVDCGKALDALAILHKFVKSR